MSVWPRFTHALELKLFRIERIVEKPNRQGFGFLVPAEVQYPKDTPIQGVEQAVKELKQNAREWAHTKLTVKAKLLRSCLNSMVEAALPLGQADVALKGDYGTGPEGEM